MQSQVQTQKQIQNQALLPQQLLVSTLTEMPLDELCERIDQELKENISLEKKNDDDEVVDFKNDNEENNVDYEDNGNDNDNEEEYYKPELSSVNDEIADYSPDDIPDNIPNQSDNFREMIAGDSLSFYDQLKEQISFYNINDKEKEILTYLIGSLSDDGLLRTSLQQIRDELDIYQNINITDDELLHILSILQSFDPAGIGAQSIQECLIIQAKRTKNIDEILKRKLLLILEKYFNLLMLKRWDKIQHAMQLTNEETEILQLSIRKLNPRPGSSMSEIVEKNIEQITPDFIVETDDYGNITMNLNNTNLPILTINKEDQQQLNQYENKSLQKLSLTEKEGYIYLKEQINKAKSFISALQQRQNSMQSTMRAIIEMQRPFFKSGDETLLKPMNLESIAQRTELHISTISRVCSSKWVQTSFGIYPLKWFFTSAAQLGGEDVSVRNIRAKLQEIIKKENHKKPYNDEQLSVFLQKEGYKVARRTVAKYREFLKIPVARLRKQR